MILPRATAVIGEGLNAAIDAAVDVLRSAVKAKLPEAPSRTALDLGARLPPYPVAHVVTTWLGRLGFVHVVADACPFDRVTRVRARHRCGRVAHFTVPDIVHVLPTVEATDLVMRVLGPVGCYCVPREHEVAP